ncbi:MAG: phosphoribosylformylglycinamidine synthase [Bacteroidota bacterium]|nr:phosphoribosylformylglycinamidine synthase [Bacteroidota bacterium]
MISFFTKDNNHIYAVESEGILSSEILKKLEWLFSNSTYTPAKIIESKYVGPRANMISPWSTNAVEITQNMGINGIKRIEEFFSYNDEYFFDVMTNELYQKLDQNIFSTEIQPEKLIEITNIEEYNKTDGLALSDEEVKYLEDLSRKINRKLTDSEVFGFSQVNSEHCRHKIFNGTFIINDIEKEDSLFQMIKKTTKLNNNSVVSAYKDNVAFIKGPSVEQFSPKYSEKPSIYQNSSFESVISIKAETHNFPTTVEPFSGAATGSGGEIRDRLAGGQGSIPLAGTAVYMTPYPRFKNSKFGFQERKWLYQKPIDILIKASNGASDFGNKFGQPLISGSLLTFEHKEGNKLIGFDKVIMLAGGVGYGKLEHSKKKKIENGDLIIVLGGDNYRIGMGGAAVSSTETGKYSSGIELNAVQRSNPEMQKRVANVIRSIVESENNFIKSIHDHGAGGHLNCISELVENVGGVLNIDDLPIGDKTLSTKEIIGNESQERMGLVISEKDFNKLKEICDRERAPIYKVGKVIDNGRFLVRSNSKNETAIDLELADFFGNSPKTILKDTISKFSYSEPKLKSNKIYDYLEDVLSLESVACKDWLTNKVDRCVTGRVALQQCTGPFQVPLNNCGVMSLDYKGKNGVATSIGHSPIISLIDSSIGSRSSIAEALTNIVFVPLKDALKSVSLSANWMWPANNDSENHRLYQAVEACADFSINLGINIPTGKDSMSMKQKYNDNEVLSPGTVIISAVGHTEDIDKIIQPFIYNDSGSMYKIDFSSDSLKLGGSALYQSQNKIGATAPDIKDSEYFKKAFNTIQKCIKSNIIFSGHDISSGGLIVTLIEMCLASDNYGLEINLINQDILKNLFSENHGIIIHANEEIEQILSSKGINFEKLGKVKRSNTIIINYGDKKYNFKIDHYRKKWFEKSYMLDSIQSSEIKALERFKSLTKNKLEFNFPKWFDGNFSPEIKKRIKAGVIREKGSNSEREMAYVMDKAGFDVVDIHMTDLMSGKENLDDIKFLVAVGGFSNSDVLGSAKGWAGTFIYNENARNSLKKFFSRIDTLSLGVCNGCQLFMELGLIYPDLETHPKMHHNDSKKFECQFTAVTIQKNNSIMFENFENTTLGIWAAHGEGKFVFEKKENYYNIVGKYHKSSYPANPNGSSFDAAIVSSKNGRHVAMMPHLERSTYPFNWGYYPDNHKSNQISPWVYAFHNAYNWLT